MSNTSSQPKRGAKSSAAGTDTSIGSGGTSSSGQESDDERSPAGRKGDRNRNKGYSTRNSTIMKEKDRFEKMPLVERRKLYKCGGEFVTLSEDQVPSWQQYFLLQQLRLEKLKHRSASLLQKFDAAEVNESLNQKVSIWAGDITRLEIDGIVNAANNSLLGGGGVDGAIHRAAGSSLKAECATLHGCETGDAKITCGYKLPAKHVLHTVGPIGQHKKQLHSCYATCLHIMQENKLRSIAFPCISTGIYDYPADRAAPVAISTVRNWLETSGYADQVDRVIFCLFLKNDIALYEQLMQVFFPVGVKPKGGKEAEDENVEVTKEKEKSSPSFKETPSKQKVEADSKAEAKTEENMDMETEPSNNKDHKAMDTDQSSATPEVTDKAELPPSPKRKPTEQRDTALAEEVEMKESKTEEQAEIKPSKLSKEELPGGTCIDDRGDSEESGQSQLAIGKL